MKDHCYIIRLDGKCNERCLFCMESENINSGKIIEFEQVAKEIISAKKNDFNHIDFYGGEPTTYPFLKKAIFLCNRLGLDVTLATNALKFHDRVYADDFFDKIELIGIRTSLHSYKADIHDKITCVKGSWSKTIEGIKNILIHNKRLTLNVVITEYNYADLLDILVFVDSIGVKGIKFSGIIFSGDARVNRHLYVEEERYRDILVKALKKAIMSGFYQIEIEKMSQKVLDLLDLDERKKIKFIHELDDDERFVPIAIKSS